MAASIPTVEPEFVYQGDTLTFQKTLADYDLSAGWTLNYSFVSNDSAAFQFNFTADTAGLVNFDTANVESREYKGRGWVTDGTSKFTVWAGKLTVLPGLSAQGDIRTQNKRTLDNINAVIEGRASSSILNSKVEGTELYRIDHDKLLELRDRYEQLVANEDAKETQINGKASRRNIYGYFS